MKFKSLWSSLRPGAAASDRPRLRVHALGMTEAQLRTLRPLVARIGECLDVLMELDARQGDIVLVEQDFARRTAPRQMAALCDARPLVTCDLNDATDRELSTLARFEQRQSELLRQLGELPLVRGISPQFGASGWDPEVVRASQLSSSFGDEVGALEAPRLDVAQQTFVNRLLRGLVDPAQPPLVATYGPAAVLRMDFAQGFALVDPIAQQRLRVRRELPRLVADDAPGADSMERELDGLAWDFGIACGGYELLAQPEDWWHTPLATCKDPAVQRYTRLPRHLELASVLFSGRVSPADLQRQTGQSVAEMRPFLQACLFLGLAWWLPEA
jgi:hypothetical protein